LILGIFDFICRTKEIKNKIYIIHLRNLYKYDINKFIMVFERIKKAFSGRGGDSEEYIEIDLTKEEKDHKVMVKLFTLKQYEDINDILNSIREGYTIAILDIKTLRQKDPIELKRAISKLKKTTDALEGTIAGFGENLVIATPSFARIHKVERPRPEEKSKFDDY